MTLEHMAILGICFMFFAAIHDLVCNFVFMKDYKRLKSENEKLKTELEVKKNERHIQHIWSFGVPYAINNHISVGQGVPEAQEGKHPAQE